MKGELLLTREERDKISYDKTHKELNGMLFKKCSRHYKNFPSEDDWFICNSENFYKNKNIKMDGLNPACKQCDVKESGQRQYNKYHSDDELKEYHREYFLEHQDYYRDVTRKYQKKKKSTIKKNQKEWWKTNKESIKQYNKVRSHKNHKISKTEWNSCKEYFNNSCAYCGISEVDALERDKNALHKEHVIHNGENDLSNCVPACKICNSSKSNRLLENWYNENVNVYDPIKLEKINQWINNDYKLYIEEKEDFPYVVKRIRNINSTKYHFELWNKDENGEPLECLATENKKNDLKPYIDKYYNNDIVS